MILTDQLVYQILKRVEDHEGYSGLARAARSARWCERPVQLSLVPSIAGHRGMKYGHAEPSKSDFEAIYFKACGTRRRNLCEPCSKIYQGDARQLIIAGLLGGKGIPDEVASHPAIFATLTAPSFGMVHRAISREGNSRPCHPGNPATCLHGRSLTCQLRHEESEEIVGSPLCPECYDFEGAVIWNAASTKLWQRTTIYLRRALAKLLGISVKELSKLIRISYAKVIEYQKRGLIHLHIVIRIDEVNNDEALSLSMSVTPEQIALALQMAVNQVKIQLGTAGESRVVTWGSQVDARTVDAGSTGAVANYIAKYATKSASNSGGLDHRFRDSYGIKTSNAPEHLRQMALTAWQLGHDPRFQELNLTMWAHDLGHRGHFLTKSRGFSVTFAYLRKIRQSWQEVQRQEREEIADERFQDHNSLYFISQGWPFAGDAYLVSQERSDRDEARQAAWELIRDELCQEGSMQ